MKLLRRNFLHLATGAAALPAVSRIARAQTYPSRPITQFQPSFCRARVLLATDSVQAGRGPILQQW